MSDTPTTLLNHPTMPATASPSELLLRRSQSLGARLVSVGYGEHLHAWLIAKGQQAFAPFSGSMTWEHFRITIAPYLCSMEMPQGPMRMPLPCRNGSRDTRRWRHVSLKEAKKGGFYWRNKIAMGQWVEKHAITSLGEAMSLTACVSQDPLIGGVGRGVGYRDLVGEELPWNEGVEDESMWNESEEEGDEDGAAGRKRWFLHGKRETKEELRMRLAVEENEDEDMKTDDELEVVLQGDAEGNQAEEPSGLENEDATFEWYSGDDESPFTAGF